MDDMNRRALRRGSAFVAALALTALPVTPAFADGPGYGGDAGQLSVSWQAAPVEPVAPAEPVPRSSRSQPAESAPRSSRSPRSTPVGRRVEPAAPVEDVPQALTFGGSVRGVGAVVQLPVAADPQLSNDALALLVRGLGFRGKSAVEVRIGSSSAVVTRADSAGALTVALDPKQIGAAQPGVSVMAVGRNQSGTEVTLFGSVPPVADGSGPMSLVPWAAGAVALTGLALWTRRRHQRHHPHPDPALPSGELTPLGGAADGRQLTARRARAGPA